MKILSQIQYLFRNKYLIALVSFTVLMLFFDRNDVFMQMQRRKELNDLLSSKAYYEQEIDKTKKQLSDLQNNSSAVEKYAREQFLMKRDNEDVFIVDDPKDTLKK